MRCTLTLMMILGLVLVVGIPAESAEKGRLEAAARKIEKQADILMDKGQEKLAELMEGTAVYLEKVAADIQRNESAAKQKWAGLLEKLEKAERHRAELKEEVQEIRQERAEQEHERLAEELEAAEERCEDLQNENAHLHAERNELRERVRQLEKAHQEMQAERMREELESVQQHRDELAEALEHMRREKRELVQEAVAQRNRAEEEIIRARNALAVRKQSDEPGHEQRLAERVERMEREGRTAIERLGRELQELRLFVRKHVADEERHED